MAWWKTLFETSEEAAMKAAEADKAAQEMKEYAAMAEWYKASPTTFHPTTIGASTTTSSRTTVSPHFPPAEINGVDLNVLLELAKLAKGLNLKTAEDVKKHFGEFYGESYATTTIKYGGIKLK